MSNVHFVPSALYVSTRWWCTLLHQLQLFEAFCIFLLVHYWYQWWCSPGQNVNTNYDCYIARRKRLKSFAFASTNWGREVPKMVKFSTNLRISYRIGQKSFFGISWYLKSLVAHFWCKLSNDVDTMKIPDKMQQLLANRRGTLSAKCKEAYFLGRMCLVPSYSVGRRPPRST